MKRFFLFLLVAAMAAAMGYAQSSSLTIQAQPTRADDGKQMYVSYCASCHGIDGRGQGPTAAALVTRPTDLTALTKTHDGKFPEEHIVAVLRFGVENPAHGSKQMPIWGPVLYKLDRSSGSSTLQTLRINNLVEYLKTLQN